MLIYHSGGGGVNTHSNIHSKGLKNERKSMKKTYKSVSKRNEIPCSSISAVGEGSQKKSKVSRKKKNISKKNVQFLEGLGLKVKQKR